MTRTPIRILGTRNANGGNDTRLYTKAEASGRICTLLEDGFEPSGIICI